MIASFIIQYLSWQARKPKKPDQSFVRVARDTSGDECPGFLMIPSARVCWLEGQDSDDLSPSGLMFVLGPGLHRSNQAKAKLGHFRVLTSRREVSHNPQLTGSIECTTTLLATIEL